MVVSWATTWLLGLELRTSGRAVSAPNCLVISLASYFPPFLFFFKNELKAFTSASNLSQKTQCHLHKKSAFHWKCRSLSSIGTIPRGRKTWPPQSHFDFCSLSLTQTPSGRHSELSLTWFHPIVLQLEPQSCVLCCLNVFFTHPAFPGDMAQTWFLTNGFHPSPSSLRYGSFLPNMKVLWTSIGIKPLAVFLLGLSGSWSWVEHLSRNHCGGSNYRQETSIIKPVWYQQVLTIS